MSLHVSHLHVVGVRVVLLWLVMWIPNVVLCSRRWLLWRLLLHAVVASPEGQTKCVFIEGKEMLILMCLQLDGSLHKKWP